jgi:iron-sulfur cluster repair protein YtfE (RIC family)
MNRTDTARVVDVVMANPQVAEVLARWGVTFCPGCYVALTSTLKEVADYNAIKDWPRFLREVADALEGAGSGAASG